MTPYYADESVTLYHGDCREMVPEIVMGGGVVDLIVADPPYAETSLQWDRWPEGWPAAMSDVAKSMWCFGSMRMFLDRHDEFRAWRLSQDIIWRKPEAVDAITDRFRRNHEHALHWYRGKWADLHHEAVKEPFAGRALRDVNRAPKAKSWHGERGATTWTDDGTRYAKTVIDAPNMIGKATHPTEKPVRILDPLIRYGCPPGGTVLDPFAGSGSTAEAARLTGRKAVLVEADERYCEAIARRLSQGVLTEAVTA